ncbi:10 kDa chaperonin 1, chloroplastic-like isoform X3 [Camellia sinensis]|uniref:10 kDa chaperonin 1, chloroplastic-like isoform X3 n=1 Tax=Camellia sinensis TaxID=4442 RepID=UPI0010368687|nr:10 kDa chaperonin 1, chloroplastic-like isoform X3 [Camellia sinensis]
MASTFITVSKAFTSHNNNNNPSSLSNQRLLGGCRNSVRVCAIAKEIEPTKVVPQADRVLIRLEKLPEKTALGVLLPKSAVQFERHLMGEILAVGAEVEQVEAGKKVDLGTDARHCFCKADDLLALVE